MNIALALVKLAADRFSPTALEEGSTGALQSLGGAAPSMSPLRMGQPSASAGFTSGGPGGFITRHLTQSAGGGVHQYSRQNPMDVNTLKGLASRQGINPERFENEFFTASGKARTPENVSRMWNTMNTESGFRDRPGDRGTSIGIGQINMPSHPEFRGWNLHDPYVNARASGSVVRRQGFSGGYSTTSGRLNYPRD
jgi:hypothetical protein